MKRTLCPFSHSTTESTFIMNNDYLTYAGATADSDIFEALGITEEWEEQEETTNQYAQEDARILKEYGY